MIDKTAAKPDVHGRFNPRRTVRLAVLFTLFMLGLAAVLWKFGLPADRGRKTGVWMRTERTAATVGKPVTLAARITDAADKPVAGFKVRFLLAGESLGDAVSDADGCARLSTTFRRAGHVPVDVIPDPTEKRDWEVVDRASVPVTVENGD